MAVEQRKTFLPLMVGSLRHVVAESDAAEVEQKYHCGARYKSELC